MFDHRPYVDRYGIPAVSGRRALEVLRFVEAAEFRAHAPHMTWWRPTTRTWATMLDVAGFDDVRRHTKFKMRFRGETKREVPRVVFHARGPA